MLHVGEVCLYDEVDRGRGDDVNRSRDGLGLIGGGVRRRGIVGRGEGRIVVWTNRIHAVVAALNLRVSGGVWLELSNGLIVRSVRLMVSQRSPAKSGVTGREVALKRGRVRGL